MNDVLQQALADQRSRSRRGEPFQVESFLEQHPGLRSNSEAILDLIYQEMVLRESRGDTPTLAEYLGRFPALAAELQIQFELEQAIEPDDDHVTITVERDRLLGDARPLKPPVPSPAPGGDFELLDDPGRGDPGDGGMTVGVDYKARQRSLNRIVTLKLLSAVPLAKDEVARLRIGVEAISRLQHPNIAQVFEMGVVGGKLCLVAEHLGGDTLAQRLDGRAWAPPQIARLMETLARAVHYAHQQGIGHGDLKPANIRLVSGESVSGEWSRQPAGILANSATAGVGILANSATAKIADFGLVKLQGKGDAAIPADILALGAILRELLTGGVGQASQPAAGSGSPPPPPELDTICRASLHPDPRRRYASALLLAEDLRRFQTGQPIHARSDAWSERALSWARQHPPIIAVAAVLGLLCIAAALLLLSNQ